MNHIENKFLSNVPSPLKPIFYHRFVDDTLCAFNNENQAISFLNYINFVHPNLKFTMDVEQNNRISFLDILITRSNHLMTALKLIHLKKLLHWSWFKFL